MAGPLSVRRPFSLRATAQLHGWYKLAPYRWIDSEQALERIDRLPSGRTYRVRMRQGPALSSATASVRIAIHPRPPAVDRSVIRARVRRLLRLDDDLREFHRLCRATPSLRPIPRRGAGRLLRSPDIWEDIVKAICCTNVRWTRSISMVESLCELGTRHADHVGTRAFPSPEQVAEAGRETLVRHVGLGYRAPFVLEIARRVADGDLDLDRFEHWTQNGARPADTLTELPGVGPVSAAYVSMLLGDYSEPPLDSATTRFAARHYFRGRDVEPIAIRRRLARYGAWRALAFWCEFWLSGPARTGWSVVPRV